MFMILSGWGPFTGSSPDETLAEEEALAEAQSGSFSFDQQIWQHVSADAKDLITNLLKVNPSERLTAAQALDHIWVRDMAPRSTNVCLQSQLVSQLKSHKIKNNKLKNASLHVIARNWSEEKIKGLRDAFIEMDINGDGYLSLEEMGQGLHASSTSDLCDVDEIWTGLGKGHDDMIDYEEFVAAALNEKEYDREDVCWAAFRQFDLDGSGKISLEELSAMVGSGNEEEVRELMQSVDEDGDGEIDFKEFMDMMHGSSTEMVNTVRNATGS